MKIKLTKDEMQATNDAIERFKLNDPNLSKNYDIEFIITNAKSNNLESFKLFISEINIQFKNINFDSNDIILTINMKLDFNEIIEIESYLTYFAKNNNLQYDGWGAFE